MSAVLYRCFQLDRAKMDKDSRTMEMSFSSELPVERSFGYEILDHEPTSVLMGRIQDGGPLLVGHNPNDQIGVVEKAWIDSGSKRGRAVVRFGSSQRAQEIFDDVVGGIRRKVSVGYVVHNKKREKTENGVDTIRATRWEPYELSVVSIPADQSVGFNRAESVGWNPSDGQTEQLQTNRKIMETATETEKTAATGQDNLAKRLAEMNQKEVDDAKKEVRVIAQREFEEVMGIVDRLQGKYPGITKLAKRFTSGELSLPDFREEAFKITTKPPESQPQPPVFTLEQARKEQSIGMSQRDIANYSFARAIWLSANQMEGGFEREISESTRNKYGLQQRGPNSIFVPFDVLAARGPHPGMATRDQLAATGSLGGNVVETMLMANSFIDALRNRIMVARLGATMLPGLVGNVTIPRQTGVAATAWAASEAAAASETSLTFDQVTLTPRQITSRVDYSWQLLQQSTPAIDGLIRTDFQNVIARAIDLAAIHGSGSAGQPTGIAATSGIGSVTLGAQGAAPTWTMVVGLETEVAIDNADIGALAYLTNARVRGKLKSVLKGGTTATDGLYIWPETPIGDGFGQLNGYRAGVTNQVASNLTKGTTGSQSAIFYGNWADLLIGMWSGMELLTNPYTQAANRIIETYAYQAVDVAVRHPESFAACLDVTTT